MPMKFPASVAHVVLAGSVSLFAADKSKPAPAPAAADPYAEVQPATECLDLNMYQRIRDEGLNRSHVMEFASALMDGIGPRLTASPNARKANEWTRDTLTKIGLENAHLEDWGEFGMGWQQTQYVGAHGYARYGGADRAGCTVVPGHQRTGHWRSGLCQHPERKGHGTVQRQAGRQDRAVRRHAPRSAASKSLCSRATPRKISMRRRNFR